MPRQPKKRRTRAPRDGEVKFSILGLFRKNAGLPDADADKLRALVPKGSGWVPLDDIAEQAAEQYGDEGEPTTLSPSAIARSLGLVPSSARRAVQELRDDGHLLSDGEGGYTLVGTESPDEKQEAWVQWVRDSATAAGWSDVRVVELDGVWHVIRHTPNPGKRGWKSNKLPPVGGSSGTPLPAYGGRELRGSPDPALGRDIAVICTPMRSMEIIDYDGKDGRSPPFAFAVSDTPNGQHFYRRWGHPYWGLQDPVFVRASRGRGGLWHERLFNDDGTPREPPRMLGAGSQKDYGLLRMMRSAWEAFQREAKERRLDRPHEPGDDG